MNLRRKNGYFSWISGCKIPPLKTTLPGCYTKKELVDPFFKFCKLVTQNNILNERSVHPYLNIFRQKSKYILKASTSANILPSIDKHLYFMTSAA